MQRLVKLIGLMLLMVLATTTKDIQEVTVLQAAMPQETNVCYFHAEQSAAEKTLEHLMDGRMATPTFATGEVPGWHPSHSKPKCLHMIHRTHHHDLQAPTHGVAARHSSPIHLHAVDYYIYALEHILI